MTNTASKSYTVKITDGFEKNNRYAGLFDTKAEAIAASRAMKAAGAGNYCVCVPAAAAKTSPAALKMAGLIETQTTDQLFGHLAHLEHITKLPEHRMIAAAISDAITAREKIDAQLDAIFEDMEFDGTYREAMLLAIAAKAEGANR